MRTFLALAVFLSACGGGAGASSFGGGTQPGVTTVAAEVDGSTAAASSSGPAVDSRSSSTSSLTSAGSSSDGTVWDMGMPDFGSTQPAGCAGKIDFLFVISAEGTMKNDQERLLTSVPGFIDAIEGQLADFDVHILVANPNEGFQITDCAVCTTDCDPQGMSPYCGAMLTPCDKKIGAGLTFPSGTASSNRRCNLEGGRRYITSDEPNIKEAFACMAQVGTGGSGKTGQAMVAALTPAFNDSDPDNQYACNGGFLRDDALLVVTIIQDTYDEDSLGTVDQWIEALRAAKHGDDDAFMVLVLTTDVDVGYQQLCLPNDYTMVKNRLRLLAEGVKHGFIDSICKDSFAPFFAEHVGHLVDLCNDFVPPG